MSKLLFASLALAALTIATDAAAQKPGEPYSVSVWAMVQFGEDGRAADVSVIDADQYPAGFVQNVKQRLAGARVPPPVLDGKPAVLKSGVEMRFMVTPTETGGSVRIDGISIAPLPTKRYLASYPEELKRVGGWQGEVSGTCTVSPQGRCSAINIVALPGMPDSVRRFAKVSLEQWEFEPQRLNGQPIEGEFKLRITLHTFDSMPERFNQDKFLRILRGR